MILSLLAIALGGALGACLRWGLGLWLNPLHATMPLGTLTANLVGGYGIGLVLGWFATQPALPIEWRLFVITGLLGGLTTFSTFSAEVVHLLSRAQFGWALATMALHVGGSFTMTALGLLTIRGLRSLVS